ncbi:SDR family NAD(P)-dependent oxidoreductase [Paenibacillus sp. GCM10023252]|uniref:SDR family NAD(P)-dependent oxidoreductase n=1 Tax=Paenibacillus sp. GCM10023252 TaxID=3252649 RepID=UPI003619FD4F
MMRTFAEQGLQGKIIAITGASRGIGQGIAEELAASGATIIAMARSLEDLTILCAAIRAAGGQAEPVHVDLRSRASIRDAFSHIRSSFGRLDVLVNNAGMGKPVQALEVTEEDWDELMDLNLKGMFFCCQEAGRMMLEQGGGKIINMSSQASIVGIPGETIYCASKGGVNQMTKVLALEWASSGITVNAIGPTFVYTPGTAERLDQPEYLNEVMAQLPLGRVGTIADIAGTIKYLVSSASDLMTGSLLLLDGGWTAR